MAAGLCFKFTKEQRLSKKREQFPNYLFPDIVGIQKPAAKWRLPAKNQLFAALQTSQPASKSYVMPKGVCYDKNVM